MVFLAQMVAAFSLGMIALAVIESALYEAKRRKSEERIAKRIREGA